MWRTVLMAFLLTGSSALAGQARAVMQVGITITGTPARAPAKSTAPKTLEQATTGSVAGARAAVVKSSARTQPRSPQ